MNKLFLINECDEVPSRQCPKCLVKLNYVNVCNRDEAERNNRSCRSCSQKGKIQSTEARLKNSLAQRRRIRPEKKVKTEKDRLKLCENVKRWRDKKRAEDPIAYKARSNAYAKTFYANNREKVLIHTQKKALRRRYGLTIEEYNQMLDKQNHSCSICKKHESEFKKRLAVDHDHDTGRIRGLLCNNCNRALGLFSDKSDIISQAVKYLKNSKN